MKRVYTDPRFPGFEVHNEGNNQFRVYEIANGQQHEIDSFTTYSDHPKFAIPDDVAERRARDYFDRMAKGKMSIELSDGGEFGDNRMPGGIESDAAIDVPIQQDKPKPDLAGGMNFRLPGGGFGHAGPASMDDMVDRVVTADDVITAWEHANAMPEGPQKQQALERVKSMSGQLESSADELVRRLIG